ncbi:MAG TPA: OmpA family protein [Bacteroidota bacterium]|nr:OmpA family protein [Bacteroidota bacterium]
MIERRTRIRKAQPHGSTDRWLLTYADLITLLLGLFVILYAMSKIDNDRYARVAQAFGGLFGKSIAVVPTGLPIENSTPDRLDIESKVRAALYEDIRSGLVSVSQDDRGVVVRLAEELLFASGSATLKQSSLASLDMLASILKTVPNEIRIEGHTDDVPIHTAEFPSNWHLSVARAVSTGEYLTKRQGVRAEKITIVGLADLTPLVPNDSAENRARNRRVEIVIVAPRANVLSHQ